MRKTGSPELSPEHAANTSSAKQSPEAIEPHHSDLPTVIGGSSPPVKRSCNAERCQRHQDCRPTAAVQRSRPQEFGPSPELDQRPKWPFELRDRFGPCQIESTCAKALE